MKLFNIATYLCVIILSACGGGASPTATDAQPKASPSATSTVKIQLENWVSTGGSYEGFDRYPIPNGRAISFNQAGDYADYKVYLDAGTYQVSIMAGTPVDESPTQLQLHLNGCLITTSDIRVSGSWSLFLNNVVSENLEIPTSGKHTLRVLGWGDPGTWQWNADYMTLSRTGEYTAESGACTEPPARPPNVGELTPIYTNGSVSDEFRISSQFTGASYPYRIYVPNSYNENMEDYDLLVLTDAQYLFSKFVNLIDNQERELIVVGIEDAGRRVTDYRPPGNARYIDFLFQEFVPEILEQYRANLDELALLGQSNGGTLVGFTLLSDDPTRPIFKHLMSFDAPYAYEAHALYPLFEQRQALSNTMNVNLVLTGSYHPTGYGAGVDTFAKRLNSANFNGLNVTEIYYDAPHNSMASTSYEDALDAIYGMANPNQQ